MFWVLVVLMVGLGIFFLFIGLAPEYFPFLCDKAIDPAGWVQTAIATFGIPILLYELDKIRRAVSQKPEIKIGLAGVHDLPLSKIRDKKTLPATVTVSRGYAHFILVVRNLGEVAAKHVKIHLEHEPKPSEQTSLLFPVVKVSEFSDDKLSFKMETNYEFVFTGGSDCVIYPNDSETFSFHITTVVDKRPTEREYPEPGDCHFRCTVWAEGLDCPVSEQLVVKVQEE